MFGRKRRPSALGEAALGAASGLVATWVMSLAYKPIMRSGSEETRRREKEAQAGAPPATIQAADAAARVVAGRAVPGERKRIGGKVVHYAYGTVWGVAFALAARQLGPRVPLATGIAFGAFLWVLSDEILVPLFRFSRAPTRYPPSTHAKGLAAHLVYGVATDATWRLMRGTVR
jgi:uncharacterized membrane protein YagU involved in acid resistance